MITFLLIIIFTSLFYFLFQQIVNHYLKTRLPLKFDTFNEKIKVEWSTRWNSLVNSLVVSVLSLIVIFFDPPGLDTDKGRPPLTLDTVVQESLLRILGNSDKASMIFSLATGYFMWDMIETYIHISVSGVGFFVHGVVCFCLYFYGAVGLFCQYWGLYFLLFEISTPFGNCAWLFKNIQPGTKAQSIAEVLFVITFISVRLILGSIWSYYYFLDILNVFWVLSLAHKLAAVIYCMANLLLTGLNFYWTYKMAMWMIRKNSKEHENHE